MLSSRRVVGERLCVFLLLEIRRMFYKELFEEWTKSEVLTGRNSNKWKVYARKLEKQGLILMIFVGKRKKVGELH